MTKMYLKSQAERAPLGIGKIPDKEISNDITEEQCKRIGIHVLPQKTDQERRLAQFC